MAAPETSSPDMRLLWESQGPAMVKALTKKVKIGGKLPYADTRDYVRHECGHIVVGKVLGFGTGGIIVKLNSAGASSEQYFSCPTIGSVSDHLMRRIQVLFAGAVAQTLQGNKIDEKAINNLFDGPPPYNTA